MNKFFSRIVEVRPNEWRALWLGFFFFFVILAGYYVIRPIRDNIGASNFDKKFRAYNSSTGALLWETTLPFSGNATPATYSIRGRQFVVIAAGGGKDRKSKSGGVYVAFFLPDGI